MDLTSRLGSQGNAFIWNILYNTDSFSKLNFALIVFTERTHKDGRQPRRTNKFQRSVGGRKGGRKDLEELKENVDKVVPKAKDTAKSLRVAADKLDQVWMDSKIAQASGTSATIVGGLLTIDWRNCDNIYIWSWGENWLKHRRAYHHQLV